MSSPHPGAGPVEPDPSEPHPAATPAAHAFLYYNVARLGLLAVALLVFYLLGFRDLALLLVAFLVSGAVSYVVLFRLRGSAQGSLFSAYRRMSDRIDEGSRREDDD